MCRTTLPKGVVYQVHCSCDVSYIGETLRRYVSVRMKENQRSVRNGDGQSAISEHIADNQDHHIDWTSTNILARHISHPTTRKYLEAINIRRYNPSINRDSGLYIHPAYDNLIKQ